MQKQFDKMLFVSKIIASDLAVLNCPYLSLAVNV